jgi:hypothetical protein
MKAVAFFLRIVSALYIGILGLFLFVLGLGSIITKEQNLSMKMLPMWHGQALKWWIVALGFLGIAAALLTLLGKGKMLMSAMCLFAFGLMVYGFFLNPAYVFKGAGEARNLALLTLGALGCFLASLVMYERRRV